MNFLHNFLQQSHSDFYIRTNVAGKRAGYFSLNVFNPLPPSTLLTTQRKTPFEIIVGKGENPDNQHSPLFIQGLMLNYWQVLSFDPLLIGCMQML